jgi:hypothetical protein
MSTILDIVKRNGSDAIVGLVDETSRAVPEVSGIHPDTGRPLPGVGDARTIQGINYKTLIRTALPSVGFRDGNQGVPRTRSVYENRLVETFIMNPRWGVDKAIADMCEDGWQALMADEAFAHLEAATQQLGRQFYYGTNTLFSGAAKGFAGLLDSHDATNMVIDATGTTDNTCSSVWAVRFGPQRVQWVWGGNGMLEPSEVTERDMEDADGNRFTGLHQELLARPGLQVTSTRFVARIKKLTNDSGKGLTDLLLNRLLELFPVGVRPDAIFMTKRSRRQLRDSRTATNSDGREAAQPMDYDGIPIVPTESLLNTETLAL